jgi:hypothetical protein
MRPLPARRSLDPRAFGPGFHARHRVPPSWFRTTSAVSSASRLRVCCTPLPALGFGAFRVTGVEVPKNPGHRLPFPRRGPYPSKGSPRQQPCRITAVVASLPLPLPAPCWTAKADVGGADALVRSRPAPKCGCATDLHVGSVRWRPGRNPIAGEHHPRPWSLRGPPLPAVPPRVRVSGAVGSEALLH